MQREKRGERDHKEQQEQPDREQLWEVSAQVGGTSSVRRPIGCSSSSTKTRIAKSGGNSKMKSSS